VLINHDLWRAILPSRALVVVSCSCGHPGISDWLGLAILPAREILFSEEKKNVAHFDISSAGNVRATAAQRASRQERHAGGKNGKGG